MSHHHESLLDERPVTSADKRAADVARRLHSMVQNICTSAVNSEAEESVHAMIILAQAANGILHLLARIVMGHEDRPSPINSTAVLYASLLAYHTAPCEVELNKVEAEFSPLVLFDALKDTEKLSGQRPDERLDGSMCRVARECAADPAMIAKVNRARSALHRGDATLN